jgi:hypothetical protein
MPINDPEFPNTIAYRNNVKRLGRFKLSGGVRVPANGLESTWQPKYAQGTLPRYRGADTHIQGGAFSWRDKIGLMFTRGRDANDCDIETVWSTDGLLNWEGPVIESDNPPLDDTTGSKRQRRNPVPGRIPYQISNAPHVQIVRNNRLHILNKSENHDDPLNDGKYRKYSRAIKRWEKKFVTLQTVAASKWLTINWPEHGMRGDGNAGSDQVKITDMIKPVAGDNSIGTITPATVNVGFKNVKVLTKDSFAILSTVTTAPSSALHKWFHIGMTVYPAGWVEDTYTVPGFTGPQPWETWAVYNLAASAYNGVGQAEQKVETMNMVQGCYKTGSGKWLIPVSGDRKFIAQVKDLFDDTTGTWFQGQNFIRTSGAYYEEDGNTLGQSYLTEPMIACDPTPGSDVVVGFLRTQALPFEKAPEFFVSLDAGATVTQYALPVEIGGRSTFAPWIGDDGYVYAFGTERLSLYTGHDDVRAAYLLRGKLSDVINPAINVAGFEIINIGEVDLLAAAESFPPAKNVVAGFNGAEDYGAPEPATNKLFGPGRSSESSRTGLPAVTKHGTWIVWFFMEQELGALQDASFDYDPKPEGTTENGFQGDVTGTWNVIRWFAIDTRNVGDKGDFPLSKYGVLTQTGIGRLGA